MARLPLVFERNVGQSPSEVKFQTRGNGYGLFLTPTDAVLTLSAAKGKSAPEVRMQFADANVTPALTGIDKLPGHTNYFIGNDPSRWLHNVSQFARVRYENLYQGIDLDFYGHEGRLEYDFTVAPGSDPQRISLQFQGADPLRVAQNGDLILGAAGRELRFEAPHVYQKSGDREEQVAGSFILLAEGRAGFRIGDYDRSRALVIDPVLTFSTYLGGSGAESCSAILGAPFVPNCPAIAVDSSGRVYVTGATTSTSGWPTPVSGLAATSGTLGGGSDVFVSRISSNGTAVSLDYLTFIGGSGTDYPAGISVGTGLNVYVAGTTDSQDFPTTANAYQAAPLSGTVQNHAFVTELDSTGSANLYSTYLSGSGTDAVSGFTLDSQARAYLIGTTTSADFPVTPGALQGQYPSGVTNQFFFAKLDPAQNGANGLLYATYFGGTSSGGSMGGGAVAVDSLFNVYLAGGTNFTDIPVVNAYQSALKVSAPQTRDIWVAKLKAPATNTQQYSLIYETYVGGTGDDVAYGVATDGTNTFVTGSTTSSDFSIPSGTTAFQSTAGGGNDAFIARLGVPTTTGTTQGTVPLNYFSYLGGSGNEAGLALTVDSTQTARFTGFTTAGGNIPNTTSIAGVPGGGTDAFFARIATASGSGSAVNIVGGSGTDIGTSLATDTTLNNYVAGENTGGGLPTSGQLTAFQASPSGASDVFVTELGPKVAGLTMDCPLNTSFNGVTINACTPTGTSGSPSPAGVGNDITFTFPIYNTGDPVNGGVFTATVPTGAGIIKSISSSVGGTCSTVSSTTISAVCNLNALNTSTVTTAGSTNTLAAIGTVTVVVTATAPTPALTSPSTISVGGVLTIAGVGFRTSPQNQPQAQINDFKVQASPASQTVTAGNQATYTITVTPTGAIPEAVSLGPCTNLPAGAACTFSSNPIPNLNNLAQSRILNITTTPRVTTPASLYRNSSIFYAFWLPVSGLAFIGAGATRRRRWLVGAFVLAILAFVVLQAGCGSKSSGPGTTTGTPAGTYTVTLNATSGSATRSTAITLTVQ